MYTVTEYFQPKLAETFEVGVTLMPKNLHQHKTGYGIIVEKKDVPEERVSLYNSRYLYTVVTDFGNRMRLTEGEIYSMYIPKYQRDVKQHFMDQKLLLEENWLEYVEQE